jgi:hypothetical protein
VEQTTAPATPGSGEILVYANTDGLLASKNDAGTVTTYAGNNAANTFSGVNSFTQTLTTVRLRTGGPTSLADDTATSFTPTIYYGILAIVASNVATGSGLVMFRCYAGPVCAVLASSAGTLLNCVTDTVLTGTTGTDGKVNISADSVTGKVYIENRRGGTTSFSWLEIG